MSKIIYPGYLKIPGILLADSDINLLDERLYGLVYWYKHMALQKCFATNSMLAKMTKSHPMSVSKSISKLAKKGYVRVILNDKNNQREIEPLLTDFTSVEVEVEDDELSTDSSNNIHNIRVKTSPTPKPTGLPPYAQGLTPLSPQAYHNKSIKQEDIKTLDLSKDLSREVQKTKCIKNNQSVDNLVIPAKPSRSEEKRTVTNDGYEEYAKIPPKAQASTSYHPSHRLYVPEKEQIIPKATKEEISARLKDIILELGIRKLLPKEGTTYGNSESLPPARQMDRPNLSTHAGDIRRAVG